MSEALTVGEAHAREAGKALERRDWRALKFHAEQMRADKPSNPAAWSFLGIALFQLGLEARADKVIAQALELLQNATRLGPSHGMAWVNLGLALSRLGRYDEALDTLQTATDIGPTDQQAWYLRASVEMALTDLTAAEVSIRRLAGLYSEAPAFAFSVPHIYLPDGPHSLPTLLTFGLILDEEGAFVCEENDTNAYGTGVTLAEAMDDLGTDLVELHEEYVLTDDDLDEGGREMADRLADMMGSVVGDAG